MKYLAAILLAVSTSTYADELLLTTLSIHSHPHYTTYVDTGKQYFGTDGNLYPITASVQHSYNDDNFGIGYQFDNGVLLGYYDNSFNRPTFYVGKEFLLTEHIGVIVYGATGYGPEMGHKISLAGGLEYKLPINDKWGANFIGIPPFGKVSGVVNLTFSYKIGN